MEDEFCIQFHVLCVFRVPGISQNVPTYVQNCVEICISPTLVHTVGHNFGHAFGHHFVYVQPLVPTVVSDARADRRAQFRARVRSRRSRSRTLAGPPTRPKGPGAGLLSTKQCTHPRAHGQAGLGKSGLDPRYPRPPTLPQIYQEFWSHTSWKKMSRRHSFDIFYKKTKKNGAPKGSNLNEA